MTPSQVSSNENLWNPGDAVALRAPINGRIWLAQSVIVVKDSVQETIVLLTPGAECVYPDGWWRWKHGDSSRGTRWTDMKNDAWRLQPLTWQRNRILIFLTPSKFYSVQYFWHHDTHQFNCYYINFQLPFRRSHCGFDSFDLELDIVVDHDFTWNWKDADMYREGIREGCIEESWATEIAHAQDEVVAMIEERRYPLDNSWMDWRPSAQWPAPRLPGRWEEV